MNEIFKFQEIILNNNYQAYVTIDGNKVLMSSDQLHQYLNDVWKRLASQIGQTYNNE